jgi:hypothetical protein
MQKKVHNLVGITMSVYARLPTCILPCYWARHSLTREDIDTIVAYVPTSLLWKCAILYGISPPWYSLRSSSASSVTVSISGKAIAVDMILAQMDISPTSGVRILDTESVDSLEHIPPIPKHRVSKEVYAMLHDNICGQLLPLTLLIPGDPVGCISYIYTFLGKKWVAVGIEGDSICINAIVNENEYETYAKFHYGYTHQSQIGKYKEDIYYLTDELVLVNKL